MDFSNAAASHAPFSTMRLVSNEYRPNPDAYDEMMAPDGSIREHWQPFLSWLQNLPPDELERRWGRVERILFENGLAFSANPMQAAAHGARLVARRDPADPAAAGMARARSRPRCSAPGC